MVKTKAQKGQKGGAKQYNKDVSNRAIKKHSNIVWLDGTPARLIPHDLDGDGKTGGIEYISQSTEVTSTVGQPTELGDSLKELNKDVLDKITNMSGMDMRARLNPIEISSILALDSLVALRFLPLDALRITRQKKRLSVSQNGKGREEIVSIVQGKQNRDANNQNKLKEKLRGFAFGRKREESIQ